MYLLTLRLESFIDSSLGAVHKLRKQSRGRKVCQMFMLVYEGGGGHGVVYVSIVYIINIEN